MATIKLIGVETGSLVEFDGSSGAALESTIVRTGTSSLTVPTAAGRGDIDITTASELWFRFYFRFDSDTFTTQDRFFSIGTNSVLFAELELTTSEEVHMIIGGGSTQTVSGALAKDVWHRIECRYKDGPGAADSEFEYKLDGVSKATLTDGTQDGVVVVSFTRIQSGMAQPYYDDIVISNTAFPGAGQIEAIRPNAVGGNNDFAIFGGDANKWEAVDDDPAVGSTGLQELAGLATQDLGLTTISDVGTINGVKSSIRAKRDNGAGTTHELRYQDTDESPQDVFDLTLTTADVYYDRIVVDAIPTTQANLDDYEFSLFRSAGGRDYVVSELWLMVDYTPAAVGAGSIIYSPSPMRQLMGR